MSVVTSLVDDQAVRLPRGRSCGYVSRQLNGHSEGVACGGKKRLEARVSGVYRGSVDGHAAFELASEDGRRGDALSRVTDKKAN